MIYKVHLLHYYFRNKTLFLWKNYILIIELFGVDGGLERFDPLF